jgi:hypothetical protein
MKGVFNFIFKMETHVMLKQRICQPYQKRTKITLNIYWLRENHNMTVLWLIMKNYLHLS